MKEFELQGPVEESGGTANAKANAMLDDGEQQAESVVTRTAVKDGDSWYWKDMQD